MTCLMQGGNPATVSAVGLWEAARAHVVPANVSEERFLETTPFLSFTEIHERAERYALGKGGRGVLEPCHEQFGEDTIVFALDTKGMVQDGQEGVFILDYPCDYTRAQPLEPGEDAWDQAAAVSCEYCSPTNHVPSPKVDGRGRLLHRIQLIRVASFLRAHPNRQRYAAAQKSAEEDREWLAYPLDYIHRLRGIACRIPLSQIWSAERYKIIGARGGSA